MSFQYPNTDGGNKTQASEDTQNQTLPAMTHLLPSLPHTFIVTWEDKLSRRIWSM